MIRWMLSALDGSMDRLEDRSARRKREGVSSAAKVIGQVNGVILAFTIIGFVVPLISGNVDKAITALAVGAVLLAIGCTMYWLANAWTTHPVIVPPRATPAATGSTDYYAIAGEEVLTGKVDPALWARALVEGDGNEQLAKAKYVVARVADLQERGGD